MSKDKKSGWNPDVADDQPSTVAVKLNRVNGKRHFFGQTMPSDNYIELTISKAHLNHDLGRDWLSTDHEIIQVCLSPTQFSELITTLNIGVGICGTMTYLKGQEVPVYEKKTTPMERTEKYGREKLQEFNKEFEELIESFYNRITESKLSKKEKEEINSKLHHLRNFTKNLKFYGDQYEQRVEQVKTEAKAELAAYITHTVQGYGLEVLEQKKQLLQLEQKKD